MAVIQVANNGMGGVGDVPATVLASTVDTTVARLLQSITTNITTGAIAADTQANVLSELQKLAAYQCSINGSADSGCNDNGAAVAQKYAAQYAQFIASNSTTPVVAAPDSMINIATPAGWPSTTPVVPQTVATPVTTPVTNVTTVSNPVLAAMSTGASTLVTAPATTAVPATTDNSEMYMLLAAAVGLYLFLK